MGRPTTMEAAKLLAVTARRVRALIESKQLPAEKKGRDYLIEEKDLALVKDRPTGRPKGKTDAVPNKAGKKKAVKLP